MSIRAGWRCIGAAWALYAIGAVFALAAPHLWLAWGALYLLAAILFAAPPVADRRKKLSQPRTP